MHIKLARKPKETLYPHECSFIHCPFRREQDGGGIYQTPIGTMTFNGLATFFDNTAFEVIH